MNLRERFLALSGEQKRLVHLVLCRRALEVWFDYTARNPGLGYVETVCGTRQEIDPSLPRRAFEAVASDNPDPSVPTDYREPIAALQDLDWEPPEPTEFAFYSIYNLYRRYFTDDRIDDWLIVNQSLSSVEGIADIREVLEAALIDVV